LKRLDCCFRRNDNIRAEKEFISKLKSLQNNCIDCRGGLRTALLTGTLSPPANHQELKPSCHLKALTGNVIG
jgi:hypothetical protein